MCYHSGKGFITTLGFGSFVLAVPNGDAGDQYGGIFDSSDSVDGYRLA